jgi:hypothetical protein
MKRSTQVQLTPELCNVFQNTALHDLYWKATFLGTLRKKCILIYSDIWHTRGGYSRRPNGTTLKWPQKYGKKNSEVNKLLSNGSDLWNTTLCRWIRDFRRYEKTQCLRHVDSHTPNDTVPSPVRHPQKQSCENTKTRKLLDVTNYLNLVNKRAPGIYDFCSRNNKINV